MHDAPLYNNQPEFIGAVIATPRTNIYQNPNSRISRTRKTGLHPHSGEADMIHHTASRIIVSPISCFAYPLHQAITIRTYKTKHGVTRRGSTCCFPSTEPHFCHIDKLLPQVPTLLLLLSPSRQLTYSPILPVQRSYSVAPKEARDVTQQ